MEEQYMTVVKKHAEGEKGKRGCDSIAHLFAQVIAVMEQTRKDVLGDLFQGAITYGEAGQFYTPEPITQLMAELTLDAEEGSDRGSKTVCDPCCGSGRMLLSVSDKHSHWEFVGQDIDLRCVRMTAINLALRNLYGYVIWGDSLRQEQKMVYRTGFNGRGFVRELPLAETPPIVPQVIKEPVPEAPPSGSDSLDTPPENPPRKATQLRFF